MTLAELTVENLRCLERVSLHLDSGHNLFWGSNGSGKTSLLEGIFLLGRGRSFRTRNSERLIKHGQDVLTVFGRRSEPRPETLGIQVSRSDETVAKIGGVFVNSLAELSRAFAVQVIEPGVHRLVEEGGERRRRWLDWTVFHVEQPFVSTWSSYSRALKQRNAALRTQPALAAAWNPEVSRLGEAISTSRRLLLEQFQPYWRTCVATLSGIDVEISYAQGWGHGYSLSEALAAAQPRDRVRGITHVGPHRADVVIRVNGKPARDVLSRGQQKLVGISMTLAQLHLIRALTGVTPTLLLDDPAAELDQIRLARFTEQIASLRCQLVVTALSAELGPLGKPDASFHVEQGTVKSV